jgi:hypothetical protein
MFALLNRNRPRRVVSQPARSRGSIIPSLLNFADFDAARAGAKALDPRSHDSFRLLIVSSDQLSQLESDGANILESRSTRDQLPVLLTSSGLGDELVEHPRRELFDQTIRVQPHCAIVQNRFHQHHWHGRGHLSVRMSRADARTVCFTTISLSPDRGTMFHEPYPFDPAYASTVSLELALAEASG